MQIERLQAELQILRPLALKKNVPQQCIKIDELSVQQNTMEGSVQNNKNTLYDSKGLNNTVKSNETDYSAEMKNLELMVEELERDKEMLNKALEEEKNNN